MFQWSFYHSHLYLSWKKLYVTREKNQHIYQISREYIYNVLLSTLYINSVIISLNGKTSEIEHLLVSKGISMWFLSFHIGSNLLNHEILKAYGTHIRLVSVFCNPLLFCIAFTFRQFYLLQSITNMCFADNGLGYLLH